ncbi:hypothetical protein MITS9509_02802 [Synechococcus sp. MIT S9509]|nr:hypothetical protein MITS9509_02802 [Synechococcus sp. MIT S9509]
MTHRPALKRQKRRHSLDCKAPRQHLSEMRYQQIQPQVQVQVHLTDHLNHHSLNKQVSLLIRACSNHYILT